MLDTESDVNYLEALPRYLSSGLRACRCGRNKASCDAIEDNCGFAGGENMFTCKGAKVISLIYMRVITLLRSR